MKRKIIGKRVFSFNKKDGSVAHGVDLFYTGSADGVEGLSAFKCTCNAPGSIYDIALSLPVGSVAYIFTRENNYGRVICEGIEVLETPKAPEQETVKK